jgi:hypothetical protein
MIKVLGIQIKKTITFKIIWYIFDQKNSVQKLRYPVNRLDSLTPQDVYYRAILITSNFMRKKSEILFVSKVELPEQGN